MMTNDYEKAWDKYRQCILPKKLECLRLGIHEHGYSMIHCLSCVEGIETKSEVYGVFDQLKVKVRDILIKRK